MPANPLSPWEQPLDYFGSGELMGDPPEELPSRRDGVDRLRPHEFERGRLVDRQDNLGWDPTLSAVSLCSSPWRSEVWPALAQRGPMNPPHTPSFNLPVLSNELSAQTAAAACASRYR